MENELANCVHLLDYIFIVYVAGEELLSDLAMHQNGAIPEWMNISMCMFQMENESANCVHLLNYIFILYVTGEELLSELAMRQNGAILEYTRTSASALSGGAAGILGLTGLYGFVFYFVTSLVMSVSVSGLWI